MPLLIGYLVALAVFLGGSYAGVQWLLAPNEPSVRTETHAESAATRLINAKKIRDARAQHRRLAESLAEDAGKPAATPASQAEAQTAAESEARIAAPPIATTAGALTEPSKPEAQSVAAAAKDPKLDARAEAAPAEEA